MGIISRFLAGNEGGYDTVKGVRVDRWGAYRPNPSRGTLTAINPDGADVIISYHAP